MKRQLLRYAFDRYYRYRVDEFMPPEQAIVLNYRVEPRPRYPLGEAAHPQLWKWFNDRRSVCTDFIALIAEHLPSLERIAPTTTHPLEPYWRNIWFSILDGMALYSLVATRAPKLIIEVGSGNSTKFAARAIRDHQLSTTITSIDPKPRAEIDVLCDEIVREPLENVRPDLFARLQPGDFLFVDSSHRVFTNSDVTTLFLDILPRIPAGVVVHIHDIFLPWDYPQEWSDKYYSEQYLLACWLLSGPRTFSLIAANAFMSFDAELRAQATGLIGDSPLRFMFQTDFTYGGVRNLWGTSLWIES